jgi:hypothetical protein
MSIIHSDNVGNREELQNKIWDVSPADTPIMSATSKTTSKAVVTDWMTDKIRSANGENAHAESASFGSSADTANMKRLTNAQQIYKGVVEVSKTAQTVETAGRSNDLVYRKAQEMLALKTDMEASFTTNRAKVESGVRKSAGLQSYINSSVESGAGAVEAAGDGSDARTPGTLEAFSEERLQSVSQKTKIAGGKPTMLVLSPKQKTVFSTFLGNNATRNIDATKKAVVSAIDIYESDFGTYEAVVDLFTPDEDIFLLDNNFLEIGVLREFKETPLENNSDADGVAIITEATIKVLNPDAHGAVYDNS